MAIVTQAKACRSSLKQDAARYSSQRIRRAGLSRYRQGVYRLQEKDWAQGPAWMTTRTPELNVSHTAFQTRWG